MIFGSISMKFSNIRMMKCNFSAEQMHGSGYDRKYERNVNDLFHCIVESETHSFYRVTIS